MLLLQWLEATVGHVVVASSRHRSMKRSPVDVEMLLQRLEATATLRVILGVDCDVILREIARPESSGCSTLAKRNLDRGLPIVGD